VVVWLRLNDPYSYLLIQVLPRFIEHFPVQLLIKIVPYQEPDHIFSHDLRDAWYLAQFHQLSFHDFQSPNEEACFIASQLLLANRHLSSHDFLILAKQVLSCLWEHQSHKLSLLTLRFPLLAASTTHKKLAAADRQLADSGHAKTAQLYHQGEWYWALDDMGELGQRLTDMGLNQLAHQFSINSDPIYQNNDYLINDWEQLASIRAQKYQLDYYFSFSDPLSYLCLPPMLALAEHYQLKLRLKPILVAELDDDQSVLWYNPLGRLAHLAKKYQVPFGDICLPTIQGLQACLTIFELASEQGLEQQITLALMQGIWAEGKDMSYLPHLQQIIDNHHCSIPKLKKQLKLHEWLPKIEQYTVEWSQLEISELPSFYLQGERRITFCGAHRLWAIEMAIVDNMKLIGSV
jgi:2-hydroxychromene-2-carboxylate isomerase